MCAFRGDVPRAPVPRVVDERSLMLGSPGRSGTSPRLAQAARRTPEAPGQKRGCDLQPGGRIEGPPAQGRDERGARPAGVAGPQPRVAALPLKAVPAPFQAGGRMRRMGRTRGVAERDCLADDLCLAVERLFERAAHHAARGAHSGGGGQVADRVPSSNPQPQVPVLDVNLAPLVEQPDGIEHGARHHDGQRVHVDLGVEQLAEHAAGRASVRPVPDDVGCCRRRCIQCGGVQQPGLWKPLEIGNLQRQLAGKPGIVRVEERDQVAAGGADARVARASRSPVGLSNHLHAPPPGVQSAGGAVLGAVVDHHDLARRIRLREDGLEGRIDRRLGIEGRDDDADGEARRRRWHGRLRDQLAGAAAGNGARR